MATNAKQKLITFTDKHLEMIERIKVGIGHPTDSSVVQTALTNYFTAVMGSPLTIKTKRNK